MADEPMKKHVHTSTFVLILLAGTGWVVAALEFTPPGIGNNPPIGGGIPTKLGAPTPTPVPSNSLLPSASPSPSSTGVSGVFDGDIQQTRYGPVQVEITVSGGKITSVTALQYPTSGRSGMISQQAIPQLVQEVLKAQSASINGVSGASYTSQGFYSSLVTAISKAGL